MDMDILQDENKQTFDTIKREYWLIIVGALVFVASFLWKDLITDYEEYLFPKSAGMFGRTIYVLLVSLILILLAVHLKTKLGLLNNSQKTPLELHFDDSPLGDSDRHLPGFDHSDGNNGSGDN